MTDTARQVIERSVNSPATRQVQAAQGQFVVSGEDLDAALDEINTMIIIQGTLQDATNGIIYLPWNGTLTPPDHPS